MQKVKLFRLNPFKESIDEFESRINAFLAEHRGSICFIDSNHVYIYYEEASNVN